MPRRRRPPAGRDGRYPILDLLACDADAADRLWSARHEIRYVATRDNVILVYYAPAAMRMPRASATGREHA
jgi:hypothetical protein